MSWISLILYFIVFRILLDFPLILIALVILYVFRDRIPSPAEFFRRQKAFSRQRLAVQVNPHDSVARRDLGMVLLEKRKPKEALENLVVALKKEDGSAEINHLVGLACLRSGQPEAAVGHLKRAIEIEPRFRYGESHLYLGEALHAMGKNEEALGSLETFLDINTTSIEGLYCYASVLAALGRKDDARKAAEDGIRFHRKNPAFRRRRDWRWNVKLKGLKRGLPRAS